MINTRITLIIIFTVFVLFINVAWYIFGLMEINNCNKFMVEREELYKKMYPLAGTVNIPVYNLTEILQWQ
jgi:hypothetical protein